MQSIPKTLKEKTKGVNKKQLALKCAPYVIFGYVLNKVSWLYGQQAGDNTLQNVLDTINGIGGAFHNPLPSFLPRDLLVGVGCGIGFRMVVYYKAKNAKKFRQGVEYGSARWGTAKDIEPYVDPVFENNVLLTATERLMMSGRPKQPKYARNKNILVIGGSGSGKTRFFVKPNLMQMHSSYVVTDPKGTVLVECGRMLSENDYRIKVLNTINFAKSMHYNPFAYIRSEKDILKLVNTIIVNTKGEGQQASEDFWVKAEKLYYTALIAYIWYEAPEEEQNFSMLIDLVDASEAREDDENFKNAVDLLFEELEQKNPNHFAVRQYKKYKLAAGVVCSKRLLNQAVGKSLRTHNLKPKKGAQVMRKNEKITALYERLSRDDFGKDDDQQRESNSISNQKAMLEEFAARQGFTNIVHFTDDGISGTCFDRPGFLAMMKEVEAGNVEYLCIKDMSRMGRDYLKVGQIMEILRQRGVRLIAINDGVDSARGDDDFTPFRNIMNEYYAKDISKKRRIVNKMKGNAGVPLSPPPYGYIKNPDDPRFWVVEPEAAEVVRRIYRMALEGYGLAETAAQLAADGVVNPTYYWRSRGTSRGGSKSTVEPTKWGHTTVKKILTLQEYCGDVINFKSYSKSYKMKKRIENPEENRAIFLNVHEAIIDRQTWEKVQALQKGTRRKKPTVTQEPSVFSGLLKCPECGGNLNFHFNQNNHDIKFFSCQNHNSGYRKCSKTHYIRLDFLEQVVLYEVKRLACFASEYENDFIKAMIGRSAKVAENTALRKQRELDALTARDRELDMLFERLYEDNVAGKIDDARFAKMSKRYEQEQGENAKKIKALRLELKKDESKRMDIDDFLETVRRYTDATTITKRMVAELIDHIEVYHAEKQDGITNQRVVIYYNCIGAFDVPDRRKIPEADIIMETRKGVALSYAPEQVAV